MFTVGSLTFLSPWMLAALSVVPVLWWLLRVTPPRPRTVRFPAFFLLDGLETHVRAAAHTPWWLLLLRALAVACFILALSDPVQKLGEGLPGGGGPAMIAVDNGWAAAANWRARQDKAREYLLRIRRDGRAVLFLPTAPAASDGKVRVFGPMDAGEAEKWISRLAPEPWPPDHAQARAAAQQALETHRASYAVFLSDGLDHGGTQAFLETLQGLGGGLAVVRDDAVNDPYVLQGASDRPGEFAFRLLRAREGGTDRPLSLMAFAAGGGALDEYKFAFPSGGKEADIAWDMLPEVKNEVARVALRAPAMASAVFLTDSRWRRRPVGVVADPAQKDSRSYLSEIYYLRRALETGGTLFIDAPEALMKRKLSAIVWPDSAPVTTVDREELLRWVENGGFLIRFAGPNLAASPDDPLLPVALRYGQRSMEGAMTWEKPVRLGEIPPDSPLAGLRVPEDVTVTRQILADPVPETFEKTWLRLEDGTPLVTGGAVGRGFIVLIHTTSGPEWSDFAYSGLYVEALQRMVSLSTGIADYKARAVLPPLMVLDGLGRLQPPGAKSAAQAVDPSRPFTPSPRTPPGIYGDSREFSVFNLGDHLPPMKPLESIPARAARDSYALSGEKSLKPDFLEWGLWLLLAETLATLFLRGIFPLPRRAAAACTGALLLLAAHPALAQEVSEVDLASGIYLAYIETGDMDTDQTSHNGLAGLGQMIRQRTTIDVKGVRAVNPATDKLYYYPFLYWPMTDAQRPLPGAALRALQRYLGEGGMIVFDTRDRQFGDAAGPTLGTQVLREVARGLQIPALAPVGEGHILTKSFYLLDSFPGRFAGGSVWAEEAPSASFDAVTSVVIGGNDWAAAWSRDPRDMARYDIVPGGERQREMAVRFGINLVMAALAGNYKADQVHVPYILERMRR